MLEALETTLGTRHGAAASWAPPVRWASVDLVEPECWSCAWIPMPDMGMEEGTVVRLELHDHGEKTRLTLSDGPLPPPGRDGAEAGWNAALEKLAALFERVGPDV